MNRSLKARSRRFYPILECPCADVRVGAIRMMTNGLGAAWAQLPIAAALKVAEIARARIGWTIARIELLGVRPLQCYKCWAYGHVQGACRNPVDRRGACFLRTARTRCERLQESCFLDGLY